MGGSIDDHHFRYAAPGAADGVTVDGAPELAGWADAASPAGVGRRSISRYHWRYTGQRPGRFSCWKRREDPGTALLSYNPISLMTARVIAVAGSRRADPTVSRKSWGETPALFLKKRLK